MGTNWPIFGRALRAFFNIYDADDQLSLVNSIFKAIGLDDGFMKYRAALSRISQAKNSQEKPQDFYK